MKYIDKALVLIGFIILALGMVEISAAGHTQAGKNSAAQEIVR